MRGLPIIVVAVLWFGGCGGCGRDENTPTPDAPTGTEVTCRELAPVPSGTCAVTAGGATKLIEGIVLTPTTVYRGGQVAVDASGQITCVGCECAEGGETVISCPDGAISPGLINTHDHITFTHNRPYTDEGIRYEHRHQWRIGQDGKPKITVSGGASADQIRWGELRFVMGGATSIVGSGGQPGLLRNLDNAANQEGLAETRVNFDTFPLDDSGGNRRSDNCDYGGEPTTAAAIAGDDAYEPHTSEGIDDTARNEFLCQSSDSYDAMAPGTSNNLLLGKTAMIHAIGLTASDLGAMAAAGTALIWSPRSNITLYGDTARVTAASRLGVEIALGTDWVPSGSTNMLRELRCADALNRNYFNGHFTDMQLWQMVTASAAAVTATDEKIGLLAPGKVADISIFSARGASYRAVLEADPQDVVLVMRGGKTLYGDDAVVAALAQDCDALDVCGTGKRVCTMGEVGKSYTALQTAAGAMTPPAFECGVPANEPSCIPERPTSVAGSTIYTGIKTTADDDGDGIDGDDDLCPDVFDPIRPVDGGKQADGDGDGEGDACDYCPLDADTTSCTTFDPADRDSDGVLNATDNCPDTPNADQADGDMDAKGDACDACPAAANPGTAGCPTTIYNIKNGTTPVGTAIRITNALVTGKGTNGFFVQVKEGDAGYAGADHSGLFVFTGTMAPALANAVIGARVTIDGAVRDFQGQIELDPVTAVTVEAMGPEAPPMPVPATYAEVKTGGSRAAQLESVIVALGAATVTATQPMFGEYTLTAGADTLVADDFLFVPNPMPQVGQGFTAVRGILAHRSAGMGQSVSKIEPRGAGDLTAGAPGLASFGPALSFAKVGQTNNAPTFPVPLAVTLSGPAQGDTVVNIMSGSADLTVGNVTIPNGQTSAVVRVTANAQNADVPVVAQLGVQMLTAHVRVVGAAEVPTVVALSPSAAQVSPGGTVQLSVTLDVPAPAGGTQVGLAVSPPSAGTVPANVTVAANQVSATFTFTETAGSGMSTVTATLGGSSSNTTITVTTATGLVINEVDYDQIMTDNAEFIEIFNPTGAAIDLAGKQIILVNGSGNTVYDTIDLAPAGSLPAGRYLVIAGANITVPAPSIKLDPGWVSDEVQNGAPDGIALIDNTTHVLLDALSYEGPMTMVDLPGFTMPVSLVEGTALPTATADSNTIPGSLCRFPNGQDSNNAAVDWKFCTTPSAGAVNP